MNKYDKTELIKLVDAATIAALLRLYSIPYNQLALRFNITREAIYYRQKVDCWKDYERGLILDFFASYGLEAAELMLINQMINKAQK